MKVISSFCPHFDRCSGCQTQATDPFPPIWGDIENFFKERISSKIALYDGSRIKWRCRAKLAVRGTTAHPLIGLFKEGTHDVEEIPFCQIHHPSINKGIEIIKAFIRKNSIEPYNEKMHMGVLRYLQLVVERKTGKLQIVFVINTNNHSLIADWKKRLKELWNQDLNRIWHSIWINLNNKKTNTIFGSEWILTSGEEFLVETLNSTSIFFHPASFAQANLDLFEQMLIRIENLIKPESKIIDFYSGVGVIGLSLVKKSDWVRCVEINSFSEIPFMKAKEELPNEMRNKISFHSGSVSDLLELLNGGDAVIVDPPRKGLEQSIVNAITSTSSLKQVVYVSCGWDSFKRDCDHFLERNWNLKMAESYLFFPGSNHIEILASFERP